MKTHVCNFPAFYTVSAYCSIWIDGSFCGVSLFACHHSNQALCTHSMRE
jgi:hypothetical protein